MPKWSCPFQTLNAFAFYFQEFKFIPLVLTPTQLRSGCCCAPNHLESFLSKFFVHHHYYCVHRALQFLWLTPRYHYSWFAQGSERVRMNSVLEMMKLKLRHVKWLAQGHKAETWRQQAFCQAQCSLVHCLPAAAPGRIDVSSRWQFGGGDGCLFVAFHCFPSYFDPLPLLPASEECLTNHQK